MQTAIYSISSSLHRGLPSLEDDPFLCSIQTELGSSFMLFGEDFSTWGTFPDSFIYVRTGGTEGIFRKLGLEGNIRLLTSGRDNSLAAAMEILAFIKSSGGKGRVLHGTPGQIASTMAEHDDSGYTGQFLPVPPIEFGGARLGVIGRPSDWLIASNLDYDAARKKLGLEFVDIPISELIEGVCAKDCDLRSFAGSEAIYEVLKDMVKSYGLSGLTLRCFDLLDTIGNTGCLALARLNSEGIVSSCEGDVPTLVTMMMAEKQYGTPGFQCNLSRITGDELLFAHCTVPLSMVRSYSYATHFESGIGTAIKGELPEGNVLLMKVSPKLDRMVAIPGQILRNQSEAGLCRTQVVVNAPGAAGYFLGDPLANHHVIVPI